VAKQHVPAATRRVVRARAAGCCEYCLIPERLSLAAQWVDHVVAEKHGGRTEVDNLALSCALCNQRKGTDLTSIDPETGDVVLLFNPRRDRWADHFRLDEARIEPLTAVGRVTVRLLQLNAAERLQERALLAQLGGGGGGSEASG
jgi:hypothetical protein